MSNQTPSSDVTASNAVKRSLAPVAVGTDRPLAVTQLMGQERRQVVIALAGDLLPGIEAWAD